MRAMRAPARARSISAIAGTRLEAGGSRSLRPSSHPASGPRSTPSHAPKTAAVESGTPGLTSRTGVPARPGSSTGTTSSPLPSPRAVLLSRQAGTSAPSAAAMPARSRSGPSIRSTGGGVGRAAADPGRNREALVEGERDRAAERASGFQHQIVGLAFERRRERAGHLQAERRRLAGGHHVAVLAKGEDRLDPMIAVGRAAADVEREVDLGVGRFAHQRAASNGVSPASILAPIRVAAAPSA